MLTLLDNISSNVERTHDHVESGNEELVQANRYAVLKYFEITNFIFSIISYKLLFLIIF